MKSEAEELLKRGILKPEDIEELNEAEIIWVTE